MSKRRGADGYLQKGQTKGTKKNVKAGKRRNLQINPQREKRTQRPLIKDNAAVYFFTNSLDTIPFHEKIHNILYPFS